MLLLAQTSFSLGKSATRFYTTGNAAFTNESTEANAQTKTRTAGTFSNLYINVVTNGISAASTLTFRKNTADGNQTVSITASTTGEFQDSINTDAVVATDLTNLSLVTGGTGTTITGFCIATQFVSTTNTVMRLASQGSISFLSSTNFIFLGGVLANISSEANAQYKAKSSFTLQNLQINITSNDTGTSSCRSRIGSVNGNLVVSITASTTGIFEDTVNSDSIVSGNLFNFAVTGGAGGTIIMAKEASVELSTTDNTGYIISGGRSDTESANTTGAYAIAGDPLQGFNTESQLQCKSNFAYTGSNLEILLSANTVSATSTFTFRINAANGNQTVSITGNTTGEFEDAVNTDTVNTTDKLTYQLACGATGTSISPAVMGHKFTLTASTPVNYVFTNTKLQVIELLGVGT